MLFSTPKIIDIGPYLLNFFENVTCVVKSKLHRKLKFIKIQDGGNRNTVNFWFKPSPHIK